VSAGGFVFVSGQLGFGADGQLVGDGISAQAHQTLENIKLVLSDNGARLSDVVKVNIWLTTKSDFIEFNKVYASYFADGKFPSRSTVLSQLLIDGARVEIDAVAYVGQRTV
tara:strand:- start:360 stop:692 length:333 start_codon:yes stop_codon:yes gene_type:complete